MLLPDPRPSLCRAPAGAAGSSSAICSPLHRRSSLKQQTFSGLAGGLPSPGPPTHAGMQVSLDALGEQHVPGS